MVSHKVILDVDPGVDDAIAIIVALQSIDIEVLGISTVNGNIDSGSGALNTLRILHALGKSNIPVLQGATKPIIKRRIVRPEHFHGKGGLGGLQLELPKDKKILSKVQLSDFIELTLKNYRKREVSIIATGPLTNIARLFMNKNSYSIMKNLGEISIMGGAFRSHNIIFGSFTKYADFNFYCDPEAAKIVINQNVNVNRKFVGLDVTTNPLCAVGPELIRKIKNIKCTTSRIKIIATLLDFAISTRKICHLHDVFAVAMLEKPSLFELKKGHIKVSLNGKMRGHSQFIEDNGSSNNILVAANVNEKALNNYLISRLLKK
ncbi:MAG TPA: nucleoside hydrolase [Nitrososphaeraceae archaeon]|nr:nucleoside hydrolase [Nitrososphaeraceae archaeon]